ncbi:MAG: Smr/MutS family protein [Alphaproteobacteria bacterium]|nr:Smr/MutS family protein [Alphaproteobacteria bacterium]
MRRGQVEIWGALDLHGLTQDQARAAVGRFVARAAADGARTVIVVTGKGGRFGGGEGVLKRRFPEWLAEPGVRAMVSGVSPAHPRHGGAGAFYVFLKRQDPARDAFS